MSSLTLGAAFGSLGPPCFTLRLIDTKNRCASLALSRANRTVAVRVDLSEPLSTLCLTLFTVGKALLPVWPGCSLGL